MLKSWNQSLFLFYFFGKDDDMNYETKYALGVDVSKGKSTISLISLEGEVIFKPFNIKHDLNDLNLLDQRLKDIPKENIKVVMEDTGNYHLPIKSFFISKGYTTISINALIASKYLNSSIRKKKNDKIDSLGLAKYACDKWSYLFPSYHTPDIYNNLKLLSRRYFANMSIQTKLKVNFSNICDLLFPGFYQFLDENNFILGLTVFKKYFHPSIVLKKKKSQFIIEIDKLAKKLGHRCTAGKHLASVVYDLASNTFSPCPNNFAAQISVETCADTLIQTIKASKRIITEMNSIAKSLPEYSLIINIPGIGIKLASLFIAEIGDIRRFKNASSLIAYAGIDVPSYQSGSFEANSLHITKRGNKYLRAIGYEITTSIKKTKNNTDVTYQYIIKKENEGKLKMVAKFAGFNKFLKFYYGIVKSEYIKLNLW